MPTITVSITIAVPDGDPTNGGDFAADIVAHVLTHYADPTISIDRTGDVLHVQHAPTTSLVDDILAYEADKAAAKRAVIEAERSDMLRARYDWRVANYDRMITFDCGFCGAVAGKPCQRPGGEPYAAPTAHGPRVHAFAKWENENGGPVAIKPDWLYQPVTLDEV